VVDGDGEKLGLGVTVCGLVVAVSVVVCLLGSWVGGLVVLVLPFDPVPSLPLFSHGLRIAIAIPPATAAGTPTASMRAALSAHSTDVVRTIGTKISTTSSPGLAPASCEFVGSELIISSSISSGFTTEDEGK
jgi:hypothetical protein